MKKLLVFIAICLSLVVSSCSASACFRFVVDDTNYLQLEKKDVSKLSPNVDTEKNYIVELYLTKKGQIRLKEFTQNNIGEYVSVYLGKQTIWEATRINTPIGGDSKISIRAEDDYISDILTSCQ